MKNLVLFMKQLYLKLILNLKLMFYGKYKYTDQQNYRRKSYITRVLMSIAMLYIS